MIKQISAFLGNRVYEWFSALNTLGIGLLIAIFPQTLSNSAFKYLVGFADPMIIGIVFALVGGTRLIALFINGRSWVYGPRIRAWFALVTAIIWFQLFYSLVVYGVSDVGTPSIGLVNWLLLTLFECVVVYRASTEVNVPKSQNGTTIVL